MKATEASLVLYLEVRPILTRDAGDATHARPLPATEKEGGMREAPVDDFFPIHRSRVPPSSPDDLTASPTRNSQFRREAPRSRRERHAQGVRGGAAQEARGRRDVRTRG